MTTPHRAVLVLPPLRAYQEPVLCSPARDDLTISAPQLGKTTTGAVWLLGAAWAGGPSEIPWGWFAPTHGQSEHGFRAVVVMARGAGVLRSATSTPPFIAKLSNGARIEARSWDRAENLYGPPFRGGVVDEFGLLTTDAYAAISSRRAETIARGEGRLVYLGNCGDIGGPAEALYRMAEGGAPGFACRRWTWRDRASAHSCRCGFLRRALPVDLDRVAEHRAGCSRAEYLGFVARERSRLSGSEFRRLYEAEWLDGCDLPVYSCFDRAVHVTDKVSLQPGLPLTLACDFNVDPMAWLVLQSHQGETWVVDEILIPGGATTQRACSEFVRRYGDRLREVVVYGDASGNARKTSATRTDYQTIREQLAPHFLDVRVLDRPANPPVTDRVNAVNAALRSADGTIRMFLHPRCRNLSADLARVSWKPGTREIDKSNRTLTHASDALGYAVFAVKGAISGGSRTHHDGRESVAEMYRLSGGGSIGSMGN